MIIHKLANANASVVSVTGTARTLSALLDTAAAADNNLPNSIDAVDLVVESGSVRYLADSNVPTASKGILLGPGIHRLRAVSPREIRLISTSGTVPVGVQVGYAGDADDSSSSPSGGGSGSGGEVSLDGAAKTRTALASAVILAAGAGNTTSSAVDLSAAYGATVGIQLANGGTGPTVAAQVQVQVANNAAGTLWTNYGGALVGSVTAAAVTQWAVEIPAASGAVRIVSGSNTAQNVTLDADISVITAL